jgi:hypothetical protein
MKERDMQEALAEAIRTSGVWPTDAPVLVTRPGDIESEIMESLAKAGLCVLVAEPDNLSCLDGAAEFFTSSDWALTVFATELMNTTGLDCLAAAFLVLEILGDTNPADAWAEPLTRGRIRFVGIEQGVTAREVTFTAAYQR